MCTVFRARFYWGLVKEDDTYKHFFCCIIYLCIVNILFQNMNFWADTTFQISELKYITCVWWLKRQEGFQAPFIKTSFLVICFHGYNKMLTTGIYSRHMENAVSEIQILVFPCYRAAPKPRLLSSGLLVLV